MVRVTACRVSSSSLPYLILYCTPHSGSSNSLSLIPRWAFLDVVGRILSLISSGGMIDAVTLTTIEILTISDMFGIFASIFAFLAIIRLASGALRVSHLVTPNVSTATPTTSNTATPAKRSGTFLPRLVGWVAYGFATLLAILNIVQFGLWVDNTIRAYNYYSYRLITDDQPEDSYDSIQSQALSASRIYFALVLMLFLASLFALGWATYAFVLTQRKPKDGSVRSMSLVCATSL